jgi:hypothetical protein
MARMTFKAGNDYAVKLSRLGVKSQEIGKRAIYAAANIVTDKIRSNLESVVSSEATGELADSLGITPIKPDQNGDLNTKIGFDGYDSRGIPNQLKARVLESGSSKQEKAAVCPAGCQRHKKAGGGRDGTRRRRRN